MSLLIYDILYHKQQQYRDIISQLLMMLIPSPSGAPEPQGCELHLRRLEQLEWMQCHLRGAQGSPGLGVGRPWEIIVIGKSWKNPYEIIGKIMEQPYETIGKIMENP